MATTSSGVVAMSCASTSTLGPALRHTPGSVPSCTEQRPRHRPPRCAVNTNDPNRVPCPHPALRVWACPVQAPVLMGRHPVTFPTQFRHAHAQPPRRRPRDPTRDSWCVLPHRGHAQSRVATAPITHPPSPFTAHYSLLTSPQKHPREPGSLRVPAGLAEGTSCDRPGLLVLLHHRMVMRSVSSALVLLLPVFASTLFTMAPRYMFVPTGAVVGTRTL